MKAISLTEVINNIPIKGSHIINQDTTFNNVEFDSRKVGPGSLFVPLTGGATDGHQYIDQAIKQGAVATLWSSSDQSAPEDKVSVIYVEDTLKAMQALAQYYRRLINPTVIGITGSNGKTTTKDMTAQVLIVKYHVHKTQGNYNNEIGVPYTLLKMPEDTEVAVIEMGMSGFGEIELLSKIAQPDIAAITLIGESHLEYLGTRAGIAKAKLEILYGLKDGGSFFYPGEEVLIEQEMPALNKTVNTIRFGLSKENDVYAYDLIEEQDKTYFKTNLDENVLCMIPIIGSYNVSNALIALSIARSLNVPIEQAIFQLAQFELTEHRLEWLPSHKGAQILNDAYNASPTSMSAILQTLSQANIQHTGRKIAVLGDIRELGDQSAAYHEKLADNISPKHIDKVYLFGSEMRHLYHVLQDTYSPENLYYEEASHENLIQVLEQDIQEDDIVLVKSSLGVDLLKVVTALTGHPTHNFLRQED